MKRFLLTNIFNASRKYKPRAPQKRPLHFISVIVHECNLSLEKQKSQLLLGVPTVSYSLYPKASVRLQVAERKQFPRVTTVLFTPWWRCFIECWNQHRDTNHTIR